MCPISIFYQEPAIPFSEEMSNRSDYWKFVKESGLKDDVREAEYEDVRALWVC